MESTRNAGKLMLRRPKGESATLVLKFLKPDADRIRSTAEGITFDGRKAPLSLLAHRAMSVYIDALEIARDHDPERYRGELVALRRMLTKTPRPAKKTPAA